MAPSSPIPIPLKNRWRDVRLRFIPFIIFLTALIAVAWLWKDYVAAPTMTAQAESVLVNVSCQKPGVLADLKVMRFQRVKAGDPIGQVIITDPKILASSLAVIQAEIQVLRVGMQPVATQQRTAMNYDRLRLDSMEQRTKLAIAKVNLQLAETEFQRMEELYKDKIVSQRTFEQAQAAQERLKNEVSELTRLVDEQEQNTKLLHVNNSTDLSKVSDDPLRASIAVQEAKLRLTEAELSPIMLTAPADGMVDVVCHRSGEAITAGEPVVTIASINCVRIVGYLRPPILVEPKVGMSVNVRTRGIHREAGTAQVMEVGTQLETVSAALLPPVKMGGAELGLPVAVSLPSNLNIRPGELVDITLIPHRP